MKENSYDYALIPIIMLITFTIQSVTATYNCNN